MPSDKDVVDRPNCNVGLTSRRAPRVTNQMWVFFPLGTNLPTDVGPEYRRDKWCQFRTFVRFKVVVYLPISSYILCVTS